MQSALNNLSVEVKRRSTTKYSMRFATARLTIGHDDAIESIEYILDYWFSYLFIGCLLIGLLIQHTVIVEITLVIVWSY